jgi:hypothetical protein
MHIKKWSDLMDSLIILIPIVSNHFMLHNDDLGASQQSANGDLGGGWRQPSTFAG